MLYSYNINLLFALKLDFLRLGQEHCVVIIEVLSALVPLNQTNVLLSNWLSANQANVSGLMCTFST